MHIFYYIFYVWQCLLRKLTYSCMQVESRCYHKPQRKAWTDGWVNITSMRGLLMRRRSKCSQKHTDTGTQSMHKHTCTHIHRTDICMHLMLPVANALCLHGRHAIRLPASGWWYCHLSAPEGQLPPGYTVAGCSVIFMFFDFSSALAAGGVDEAGAGGSLLGLLGCRLSFGQTTICVAVCQIMWWVAQGLPKGQYCPSSFSVCTPPNTIQRLATCRSSLTTLLLWGISGMVRRGSTRARWVTLSGSLWLPSIQHLHDEGDDCEFSLNLCSHQRLNCVV